MPPHGRGYTRRTRDGEDYSARPPAGQARWPPQASEERPPRGAVDGKAGCLGAPAARKTTVQRRDSPLGSYPLDPLRGREEASGHLSTEGGGGGSPGRARAAGGRGRRREAPEVFFLTWWFWTSSGRVPAARARRPREERRVVRCIYSGLRWVQRCGRRGLGGLATVGGALRGALRVSYSG